MSFAEQFLTHPSLFPERLSGESPGEQSLRFSLAGFAFALEGLSQPCQTHARARLARDESALKSSLDLKSSLELVTRVFIASPGDFRDVAVRGWQYALDFDYRPDGVSLAGLHWMARSRLSQPTESSVQGAIWTSLERPEEVYGVLENYLRVCLAYRCLLAGGVMLHSAAVLIDGKASLFVGRSGAGKSTIAKLAVKIGLEVLSDDLNVALPTGDGTWRVSTIPFTGDVAPSDKCGQSFELAGIYRLDQAAGNQRIALGHAEKIASLVTVCPYVNKDSHRESLLWTNLESLAALDVQALRFAPSTEVFEVLRHNPRRGENLGKIGG